MPRPVFEREVKDRTADFYASTGTHTVNGRSLNNIRHFIGNMARSLKTSNQDLLTLALSSYANFSEEDRKTIPASTFFDIMQKLPESERGLYAETNAIQILNILLKK